MKTKLLSALLLSLALLNSACSLQSVGSDQVKTEEIYQDYSVTYYEASNSTQTSAQFLAEGGFGHSVELLYPSAVLVNNAAMYHHLFLGSWYDRDFNGFIQKTIFKYIDSNNQVYQNEVTILPVSLKSYSTTVDKKKAYKVEVTADNLRKNENVVVQICQPISNDNNNLECVRGDSKTDQVGIASRDLKKLNPGSAKMTVSREYSEKTTQNTKSSGRISTSYVSVETYVNIVE